MREEEIITTLPDNTATPEDLEDIRRARAEYARGETIPHEAIHWD